MNNYPFVFAGIFITFGLSWVGLVLTSQVQYGDLIVMSENYAVNDEEDVVMSEVPEKDATLYPGTPFGAARQGKEVYMSMGCIYCHTQQVRRSGLGTDFERGWGDRQSFARDYIRQDRVLLGSMRTGPDLTNVGSRLKSASDTHLFLYDPRLAGVESRMPSYSFLYEKRRVRAEGASPHALKLPPESLLDEGFEIVPTERAEALVAYLLNLKVEYRLPEVLLNTIKDPVEEPH